MGGVPRPGLFDPTFSMREPPGWNSPRELEEAEKNCERGGGTRLVTLDRTKAERNGAGSDRGGRSAVRGTGETCCHAMAPSASPRSKRARSPTALSLPRLFPLVVLHLAPRLCRPDKRKRATRRCQRELERIPNRIRRIFTIAELGKQSLGQALGPRFTASS